MRIFVCPCIYSLCHKRHEVHRVENHDDFIQSFPNLSVWAAHSASNLMMMTMIQVGKRWQEGEQVLQASLFLFPLSLEEVVNGTLYFLLVLRLLPWILIFFFTGVGLRGKIKGGAGICKRASRKHAHAMLSIEEKNTLVCLRLNVLWARI